MCRFSSSLLLVVDMQVAGSGYVFGAYTAVPWPSMPIVQPGQNELVIQSDPSGECFLFSLTNMWGRPFRLSLQDRAHAICIDVSSDGPCWGCPVYRGKKQIAWPNIMLTYQRKGFSDPRSLAFNDPTMEPGKKRGGCAYTLDPITADEAPLPPDFVYDESLFTGAKWAAAETIEIYRF
jgi:hypothetical protein